MPARAARRRPSRRRSPAASATRPGGWRTRSRGWRRRSALPLREQAARLETALRDGEADQHHCWRESPAEAARLGAAIAHPAALNPARHNRPPATGAMAGAAQPHAGAAAAGRHPCIELLGRSGNWPRLRSGRTARFASAIEGFDFAALKLARSARSSAPPLSPMWNSHHLVLILRGPQTFTYPIMRRHVRGLRVTVRRWPNRQLQPASSPPASRRRSSAPGSGAARGLRYHRHCIRASAAPLYSARHLTRRGRNRPGELAGTASRRGPAARARPPSCPTTRSRLRPRPRRQRRHAGRAGAGRIILARQHGATRCTRTTPASGPASGGLARKLASGEGRALHRQPSVIGSDIRVDRPRRVPRPMSGR